MTKFTIVEKIHGKVTRREKLDAATVALSLMSFEKIFDRHYKSDGEVTWSSPDRTHFVWVSWAENNRPLHKYEYIRLMLRHTTAWREFDTYDKKAGVKAIRRTFGWTYSKALRLYEQILDYKDNGDLLIWIMKLQNATREQMRSRDFGYHGEQEMGFEWVWVGEFGTHRDADNLQASNYEAAQKIFLEINEEDIVYQNFGHWAVGWVETPAIRVYDKDGNLTEMIRKAFELHEQLEQYPALDDEDLSRRDYEDEIRHLDWQIRYFYDHVDDADEYLRPHTEQIIYNVCHHLTEDRGWSNFEDDEIREALEVVAARRPVCPVCEYTLRAEWRPGTGQFVPGMGRDLGTWVWAEMQHFIRADEDDEYDEAKRQLDAFRQQVEDRKYLQPLTGWEGDTADVEKPFQRFTLIKHPDNTFCCPNCFRAEMKDGTENETNDLPSDNPEVQEAPNS